MNVLGWVIVFVLLDMVAMALIVYLANRRRRAAPTASTWQATRAGGASVHLRHLGTGVDYTVPDPVVRALDAGNKIEAIKRFREATDLGLKDSKEAVEAVERAVGEPRVG